MHINLFAEHNKYQIRRKNLTCMKIIDLNSNKSLSYLKNEYRRLQFSLIITSSRLFNVKFVFEFA